MVFVTPGDGMAIRAGQHVGVDGRVYHPYLRDWAAREVRCSISDTQACLCWFADLGCRGQLGRIW